MSWLFDVLDELGLAYATRTTPRGVPYAAFRTSDGETAPLNLSVLSENETLRLTAHDSVPLALSFDDLLEVNRRLPLARAYLSPEDGSVEIALSCYLGTGALAADQLGFLLGHLRESRAVVSKRSASAGGLPLIGRAGLDVAAELPSFDADLGIDQLRYHLTTSLDDAGWIVVRAGYLPVRLVPFAREALATVQRLQVWTVAGRYTVGPGGELSAEVATPLLSGQQAGEAIAWSARQAELMLHVAARHLGLG
ncbi:hypothetical protein [Flindersiella endophytica]